MQKGNNKKFRFRKSFKRKNRNKRLLFAKRNEYSNSNFIISTEFKQNKLYVNTIQKQKRRSV